MYGDREGGFRPRRSFAPVKVGEELDVKVEAVGEKGDGVAKVKGFVLFIPGVNEGDEVKVKVTKVLRKVGFAEVVGRAEGGSEAPRGKTSEAEEEPKDSEDFGEESSEEKSDEDEDTEDFGDEEEK